MKILKLEILNLASLDNPQGEVINFEEGALRDSTIFSIVGPTGSGKSTILDAICLALYNLAPRYPRRKGEKRTIEIFGEQDSSEKNRPDATDNRHILTRGKKDGYSKLTFLANNNNIYRAEWHVHFNISNFDKVKTLLYQIVDKNGTIQEIEAQWDDIPQIIGLDYDQFLRTVLIAQGSFANFLTAKENERYELLEKLIGCEALYTRIAEEIRLKKEEAKQEESNIKGSVTAIEEHLITDPVLLQELKDEIAKLQACIKNHAEQTESIKNLLLWYKSESEQIQALEKLKNNVEKAKSDLDQLNESIQKLALHDALDPGVDLLRDYNRISQEIETLKRTIDNTSKEIAEQSSLIEIENKGFNELKKIAEDAKKVIEEKTPHIKKAREIKVELNSASNILKEKGNRYNKAESEKNNAEKNLSNNRSQIDNTAKKFELASSNHQTLVDSIQKGKTALENELTEIDNKIKEKQVQVKDIDANNLQKDKTEIDNALSITKEGKLLLELMEKAQKETAEKSTMVDKLTKCNDELGKKLQQLTIPELTQEVDTLQKSHTLMTSTEWASHRNLLEEGKACPLCGATHHPYKNDDSQFNETISKLDQLLATKKALLQQQQEDEKKWSNEKMQNEGALKGLNERLQQLASECKSNEQKWQSLVNNYSALTKESDALQNLLDTLMEKQTIANKKLSDFNTIQAEINNLGNQKDNALKKIEQFRVESETKKEQSQKLVDELNTEMAKLQSLTVNLEEQIKAKNNDFIVSKSELETAQQNVRKLQEAFNQELGGENPDTVESQMLSIKEKADKNVEDKQNLIIQLNEDLSKKNGQFNNQKEQEKVLNSQMSNQKTLLMDWIDEYNQKEGRIKDINLDDLGLLLLSTDNWDVIRKDKETKSQRFNEANALYSDAVTKHTDHQQKKPSKTEDELSKELADIETKDNKSHSTLLEKNRKLQNHFDAEKAIGDIADKLNRAKENLNNWTMITDAIGSDGKTLRKIAQCYTLSFLIKHANEEIRKFNSRYELVQVKNSLAIRVIDHDRADDIRDTTSLSGGETFIVSLGLALGLSALSSRNISFDNLFIDEGFGTLDPDTLSTVIDSLAMLQNSQGKKVGVISHTDTMSERIGTQIRIIKRGHSGSSHIEIFPC